MVNPFTFLVARTLAEREGVDTSRANQLALVTGVAGINPAASAVVAQQSARREIAAEETEKEYAELKDSVSQMGATVTKVESTVSEMGDAVVEVQNNVSQMGNVMVEVQNNVSQMADYLNETAAQLALSLVEIPEQFDDPAPDKVKAVLKRRGFPEVVVTQEPHDSIERGCIICAIVGQAELPHPVRLRLVPGVPFELVVSSGPP